MSAHTLEMLRQAGVDAERLRDRNLAEIDLSHKSLVGIDLRGFALGKVNLEHANLSGSDLRGLQFATANCVSACFIGADLRGASLAFGYFHGADFRAADLRGARLSDCLCNACDFSGADLRGAQLGYEHYDSAFRGADLRAISLPTDSDFAKLHCDTGGAVFTLTTSRAESNLRRLPRVSVRPPLAVVDKKASVRIGRLSDVSTQGLRLAVERPVTIDTVFSLRIELPAECSYAKAVDLGARSIWCKSSGEEGELYAGFRIESISPDNLGALEKLVGECRSTKGLIVG